MPRTRTTNRIVVVGDLVASRDIAGRSAVQGQLKASLKSLNAKKGDAPLSPYTITLGDEFQAVFSGPGRIFHDALRIMRAIHPVRIRFSFGIGVIVTDINTRQAIGMDGPAFHFARAAIDQLKRTKNLFVLAAPSGIDLALANQSLDLVSHLIRKWNRNQFDVLLGVYERRAVKDIASDLGVTDKAVYKAIEAGAMKSIVRVFEEITLRLAQTMENA
jgi:DNA-binding phage protein